MMLIAPDPDQSIELVAAAMPVIVHVFEQSVGELRETGGARGGRERAGGR
ncbi:hypothetical protein ABGB16_28840 [Micromonospora sp. B11E3]